MKLLSNIFRKRTKRVNLILDENGKNYIGGRVTSDITLPTLETSPMVYFGFISKNETHLALIDFDLHLICPLFIDLQRPIFLDYSNPLKPNLIRDNVPSNLNRLFEEIPAHAYIEYKKLNFRFDNASPKTIKIGVHEIPLIDNQIGNAIEPNWIHDAFWPICPITNNKMKFLFQLSEVEECKTVTGQDILDKEYIDSYLNFGHGQLYIFYEPKSKVIAYLNQI